MRHTKKTLKLGRKSEHRNLLLANQVCSLIEHSRIRTTLAKAKAVRPFAERMVTLGKRNDLHARRLAFSFLRQKEAVRRLFADVAPRTGSRQGGYVRIIKLGPRTSDSALMAYIEWVDQPMVEEKPVAEKETTAKK
jgi:large subunit ribosomal protein L17